MSVECGNSFRFSILRVRVCSCVEMISTGCDLKLNDISISLFIFVFDILTKLILRVWCAETSRHDQRVRNHVSFSIFRVGGFACGDGFDWI